MRVGLFAVIPLQASQRGKPGWFEIELLFDRSLQNGDRQNDEQLDQRETATEARSRASRTQERIRSPKSAINANSASSWTGFGT